MKDEALRWTWNDNLCGDPGEDELQESKPVMTYTIGTIDPVALKAALAARRVASLPP